MHEHWMDAVRARPTVIEAVPSGSHGVHESILRAYGILEHVKDMLDRGDSQQTVRSFIEWAESKAAT